MAKAAASVNKSRKYRLSYVPSVTLERFHASNAFNRLIIGPRGSGKSTGCSIECFRRGNEQVAFNDLRRTRWAIVRNTYRELEDTTIKTWLNLFPEEYFGKVNWSDMTQMIRYKDVEMEILFRSLDKPKDVAKLLSMELTGAWVNEVREMPKSIVDGLSDCVGRFPRVAEGGCTWRGVIMDTNPPDDDHWIYNLAEIDYDVLDPAQWSVFKQPGGLLEVNGKFVPNPDAENLANLEPNYYMNRISGKNKDHIRVYYCSQYGMVMDGKPVIPEYVDAMHCTDTPIDPVIALPIAVGVDFGLTPAAIFEQRLPNGRIVWIDELVTEDMGMTRFGILLREYLMEHYRNWLPTSENDMTAGITITGDPAGMQRAQTDESTPFQILNAALEPIGLSAEPAYTNDFTIRREAIAHPLERIIDGKPGLMISPKCKITRKGLKGGYAYRRVQVSGQERFRDTPDKNRYSHPVEAGGYGMLSLGAGEVIITPGQTSQVKRRSVTAIMDSMSLPSGGR